MTEREHTKVMLILSVMQCRIEALQRNINDMKQAADDWRLETENEREKV